MYENFLVLRADITLYLIYKYCIEDFFVIFFFVEGRTYYAAAAALGLIVLVPQPPLEHWSIVLARVSCCPGVHHPRASVSPRALEHCFCMYLYLHYTFSVVSHKHPLIGQLHLDPPTIISTSTFSFLY